MCIYKYIPLYTMKYPWYIHCVSINRGRHLHRHLGFFEPVDFVRFTRGPLASRAENVEGESRVPKKHHLQGLAASNMWIYNG